MSRFLIGIVLTRIMIDIDKSWSRFTEQGSSRSGVLGEVTINLGDFAASKHPQQKGLALRNCTTGTLLHVRPFQL